MLIVRLKDNLRLHLKRLVFLCVFTLLILPTICSATTNTTTNTTTSGSTTNTGVYYKNPDINTIQKGYKVTTDAEMTIDFTGTNYSGGSCYIIRGSTASPLFVPTRSETEWLDFYNWARNPNNGVTIVPCKPTYTDTWSAGSCSTTCGSGTIQGAVCSGTNCDPGTNPNGTSCSAYATCSCGALASNAAFCSGQNTNFTSAPPANTYTNPGACDGSTKCQAACSSQYFPNGSGCSKYCGGNGSVASRGTCLNGTVASPVTMTVSTSERDMNLEAWRTTTYTWTCTDNSSVAQACMVIRLQCMPAPGRSVCW